jgi:rhomboid protease GluP
MFGRTRQQGSILCPSCGKLVGVRDAECLSCGRKNPGLWGFGTALAKLGRSQAFVQAVIGGCALLYLMMIAVDPGGVRMNGLLSLGSPSQEALVRFGASGALPVFGAGRWWTLLSAGWLHGSILHIAFNMMWLQQLAPQAARLYGAGRMVILYTVSTVAGFLLSSLVALSPIPLGGGFLSLGASAAIFGFFGALVWYGRRTGSRALTQQALYWTLSGFVFALLMPGIDNWAHLGGFAGGYLAARWLDPLEPERGNHTALALACLVATAAAIVASLVVRFP